ncbi:unnamed protein product, partial [Protopolystoma xenopodis]
MLFQARLLLVRTYRTIYNVNLNKSTRINILRLSEPDSAVGNPGVLVPIFTLSTGASPRDKTNVPLEASVDSDAPTLAAGDKDCNSISPDLRRRVIPFTIPIVPTRVLRFQPPALSSLSTSFSLSIPAAIPTYSVSFEEPSDKNHFQAKQTNENRPNFKLDDRISEPQHLCDRFQEPQ